ncbi:MAG: hypothetical protein WBM17_05350 [Anaerolineales bacterium]
MRNAPDIRRNGLLERLAGGQTLIADGAMGTFLLAQRLEPDTPPEEWNDGHPRVRIRRCRREAD